LHPFKAVHDGLNWPSRGDEFPVDPNYGSFDVYSRLHPKPKKADGGAIKLTPQQWDAIQRRNGDSGEIEKWLVGTTAKVMMWPKEQKTLPVFHYPLCFGGNWVYVLERKGKFARISTWPRGEDVPENLPSYYWHRCWSVFRSKKNPIRDAPAGVGGVAVPVYMLVLAHSDSAWIWNAGLIPA
jgi:hypothetical protein